MKVKNNGKVQWIRLWFSTLSSPTGFSVEKAKESEKAATHYKKECIEAKTLYDDAEEQIRSIKAALENSYK